TIRNGKELPVRVPDDKKSNVSQIRLASKAKEVINGISVIWLNGYLLCLLIKERLLARLSSHFVSSLPFRYFVNMLVLAPSQPPPKGEAFQREERIVKAIFSSGCFSLPVKSPPFRQCPELLHHLPSPCSSRHP